MIPRGEVFLALIKVGISRSRVRHRDGHILFCDLLDTGVEYFIDLYANFLTQSLDGISGDRTGKSVGLKIIKERHVFLL